MDHGVVSTFVISTYKIFEDNTEMKIKYIIAAIISALGYIIDWVLAPIGGKGILGESMVGFVLILYFLDLLTGVYRTVMKKNGECKACEVHIKCGYRDRKLEKLSSAAMGRGLLKGVVYAVITYIGLGITNLSSQPILGFLANLGGGAVILMVCLTEILSILENLACISVVSGVNIPLIDRLLRYFKKKQDDIETTPPENPPA